MTVRSSLFSLCPSCGARASIQHTQASLRCLSCNFDFSQLGKDSVALDRWMEPNLREGSVEMTITLRQLITQVPEPQARAAVTEFMQQRGIATPKSGGSPLLIIGIVVVAIIGAIVLFVVR